MHATIIVAYYRYNTYHTEVKLCILHVCDGINWKKIVNCRKYERIVTHLKDEDRQKICRRRRRRRRTDRRSTVTDKMADGPGYSWRFFSGLIRL